MTFESVHHLFVRLKDFHDQASNFYRKYGAQANNERLRLLFAYLADEEKIQADQATEFLNAAEPSLLKTGYQFASQLAFDDDAFNQPINTEITLKEVRQLITDIDATVLDLYQQLAAGTILPEKLHTLFGTLVENQKQHRNTHMRSVLEVDDI